MARGLAVSVVATFCMLVGAGGALGGVSMALAADPEGSVSETIELVEARELPDEQWESARSVLQSGLKGEADSGRLRIALATVEMWLDNGKKARAHARQAVKMEPENAQIQYMRGEICFSTIDGASILDKGAIASAGRKSFQRAIDLDPEHLAANLGLARYYIGAPAIAGGSLKKAEELGKTIQSI